MDRLLRVKDIVRDSKTGEFKYLSISKSAWWAGVSSGIFPKPLKFGKRTTCWRESDILALMKKD